MFVYISLIYILIYYQVINNHSSIFFHRIQIINTCLTLECKRQPKAISPRLLFGLSFHHVHICLYVMVIYRFIYKIDLDLDKHCIHRLQLASCVFACVCSLPYVFSFVMLKVIFSLVVSNKNDDDDLRFLIPCPLDVVFLVIQYSFVVI